MRNAFVILLGAVALSTSIGQAAEPSTAAQYRAALYQREVRAALAERHWSFTQDEAGKLTAERHRIGTNGTADFLVGDNDVYVRLQIDFHAVSKNRTISSARTSLCVYEPSRSHHDRSWMAYPPLPLHDPKLTQEYAAVLTEAQAQLASGHPTYAAAGKNILEDASIASGSTMSPSEVRRLRLGMVVSGSH